jgi:hypothetical protein
MEWLINCRKQLRRLATHYKQWAENCQAMWLITAMLPWLSFAHISRITGARSLKNRADDEMSNTNLRRYSMHR